MYSKQQSSQLRQEFWTTFGQYMAPILSAEAMRVNWVNYKTGEPNLSFRMDADNKEATVAIVLSHSQLIRELYYEQLAELKPLLHEALGEEWIWVPEYRDEHGRTQSKVYTILRNVSVFNKQDWQALISFFKPRIIALDAFWSDARLAFEALR